MVTMNLAHVPNVVKDAARNNTYIFYAYRKLEEWELRRMVATLLAGKKRIGKNKEYKVFTSVGGNEPIDERGWR